MPNRAIRETAPAAAPRLVSCILVFFLFFGSGAAGLIYEVLWTRKMTYIFGATLPAVSTVLAAFMGGLALGSLLLGRTADRLRKPLRFYALLELGIAAGALLVPFALRALEPLNDVFYGDFSKPFAIRAMYQFAVSFLVLLIPTTMMGATLPVLSRFMARRRESLGLSIGGLYSANTFGAVAGAFAAGFFLIEALGVWGAMFAAAALNTSAGLLALALSAAFEKGDARILPDAGEGGGAGDAWGGTRTVSAKKGGLSAAAVARLDRLAIENKLEAVVLSRLKLTQEVVDSIPADFATERRVFPVRVTDDVLWVAVSNPEAVDAVGALEDRLNKEVAACLADPAELDEYIRRFYVEGEPAESAATAGQMDVAMDMYLETLFDEAVRKNATEVQFEQNPDHLRARYKVDGVFVNAAMPPIQFRNRIIPALKSRFGMFADDAKSSAEREVEVEVGPRTHKWRAASKRGEFGEILALYMGGSAKKAPMTAAAEIKGGLESAYSPRLYYVVLVTYALSGFAALCYQVVWTRGMAFTSDVLQSSTYHFSAMLTVFLTGLALGSAIVTPFVDRQKNPARLYALLLVALGLAGGLSGLLMFNMAHNFTPFENSMGGRVENDPFLSGSLDLFARSLLVMGLPTLLMGMAFPAAAKICVPHLERVGGEVGRLYAFNTIGAIAGAFAAGFLLIPALGMSHTILLLSALSMTLGIVTMFADPRGLMRDRAVFTLAAAAAIALFYFRLPTREATFVNTLDPSSKVLGAIEGPLATVWVTESNLGDREIMIDKVGVAGTNRTMLTDQKSLAHLPMLILDAPKKVMTVGFGSGGASYSYTLYPELDAIDCVEISRTVPTPHLQDMLTGSNHGLLGWRDRAPNYNIIYADARSYLRYADSEYDSIATDCTDLRYKTNANLYDLEYFTLCRDRITPEGAVVVWMPLGALSEELFLDTLNTFHEAFEDMHVWYFGNGRVHYVLLVGFKHAQLIDYAAMKEKIAREAVSKDLAEIDMSDPDKLLACYVTGGAPLSELLAGHRLNRENNPILEFEAPRSPYSHDRLWGNLQKLYEKRQSVLEIINPRTITEESAARIRKFEAAAPAIARGLALEDSGALPGAALAFLEARETAPDDPVLDYLLDFPAAKKMFEMTPDKTIISAQLARVEFEKKNYELAAAYSRLALFPPANSPHANFDPDARKYWEGEAAAYGALARLELGRREDAVEYVGILMAKYPQHGQLARVLKLADEKRAAAE